MFFRKLTELTKPDKDSKLKEEKKRADDAERENQDQRVTIDGQGVTIEHQG